MTEAGRAFTDGVRARLNHYASRGAFRAFAPVPVTGSGPWRGTWSARWHHDRTVEFVADGRKRTITLKHILTDVQRQSPLDGNLRTFVANLTGSKTPRHRRLGESRKAVRVTNRRGDVSIALKADEGIDGQTLTDRAVNLGHQIYTVFLREGGYDAYLLESLDLDLDACL